MDINASGVAKTINDLKAITEQLGILGIDVCNLSTLGASITKAFNNFLDQIHIEVDSILSMFGGNALLVLVTILAQLLITSVTTILDKFLYYPFYTLVTSLISSFFSFINSIINLPLILKYYLIRSLKTNVEQRQQLSRRVVYNLDYIIKFYNIFLKQQEKKEKIENNVLLAKVCVDKSISILSAERDRCSTKRGEDPPEYTQVKSLYNPSLIAANREIEKAITYLKGVDGKIFIDNLAPIASKYGFSKVNLNFIEKISWNTINSYFELFGNEIKSRFVVQGTKGTAEYEQNKKRVYDNYLNFLTDLFPVLPDFIEAIILQQFLSEAVDGLFKAIPVQEFTDIDLLKRNLGPGFLGVFDSYASGNYYPNFTLSTEILAAFKRLTPSNEISNLKIDISKGTLQDKTTTISYLEGIILTFDSLFSKLNFFAAFGLSTLLSIIENLKKTSDTLNKKEAGSFPIKQILSLSSTSARLKGLYMDVTTTVNTSFSGKTTSVTISKQELDIMIDEAKENFNKLINFIISKNYDIENMKTRKEPITFAEKLAREYLLPLRKNYGLLLNKNLMLRTLAGIQALKIILSTQERLDSIELGYCYTFLNALDKYASFRTLRDFIDSELLTAMMNGGFIGWLASALMSGDIAAIANILESLNSVTSLINCMSGENFQVPSFLDFILDNFITPTMPNIDIGEIKNTFKTMQVSINDIKDKTQMFSNNITNMDTLIKQLSGE